MTVFVVHPVNDDISPARKFGELRYVNRYYVYGDELEADPQFPGDWNIPQQYRSNMALAALDFHPQADYLLIAGDHLQLLAFTAVLFACHPSIMVLRYDRKIEERYIPVRLHAGLAHSPRPVLGSSHIGEKPHGKDRNQGHNPRYSAQGSFFAENVGDTDPRD